MQASGEIDAARFRRRRRILAQGSSLGVLGSGG